MAKRCINPPQLSTSPANRCNHAVKVGNAVYIAGQASRFLSGQTIYAGDSGAQKRRVWANRGAAVIAAGGSLTDILKTST